MQGRDQTSEQLDQDLVQRVQAGDKAAFDILVTKYQHRVTQLVGRFVKDQTEAQDVAQEAFIKAYRALPNFRGDSAFFTWLYRIAINTAKNYLVARSRRPSDIQSDIQEAEQFEGAQHLREYDTPEQLAIGKEVVEMIHSAIEGLPDELKTAITLREFEGLSYSEIAEAMECPVGTVRSRIFRAREAIDKKIQSLSGNTE
ncbi:MAG: RNA polymerase sigma factor RpoE [Gammaproteobacteria bacterium]|nr:RNA polymerase sigma factor RpoE [Gammaproteobacteria bacterium]